MAARFSPLSTIEIIVFLALMGYLPIFTAIHGGLISLYIFGQGP
jgi:hypothetical protein